MITVSHNLESLNQILAEYKKVSGLTTAQVLIKKGSDLSFRLSDKLKLLKAGKGGIAAQNIAMLRGGKGIRVRDSVQKNVMEKFGAAVNIADRLKHTNGKGLSGVKFGFKDDLGSEGKTSNKKGLNLRNLIVKREISARESGRGYLAWAGMMKVKKLSSSNKQLVHLGRLNQQLGNLGLSYTDVDGSLTFHWGGMSKEGKPIQAGQALAKPRQQRAIDSAIEEVRADMVVYLKRKHTEAIQRATESAVRAAKAVTL